MPFGIPKTENERQETHKIIYGTSKVPRRRGKGMSEAIRKEYRKAGMKAPDGKGIHTLRFHRCVIRVSKKGDVKNPYAVCMSSLGSEKAVKAGHRR